MKKILQNQIKMLKFYFPRLYFLYVTAIKCQRVREISSKPWIDDKAVIWLEQNLKARMKVFEYGSGGSTLFMSSLAEKIISIEHDPVFYIILKDKIKNCQLVFSSPNSGIPEEALYASTDEKYKNMSFKKYVETINKYPNNYFDFVFIDGRVRNSCVINALPKIKDGGYILLDNSDRLEYKTGKDKLANYPSRSFKNQSAKMDNYCETTIWQINKKI